MIENTADKFYDELNAGERIVWSGQPQQGFLLRPSDALIIPLSLLWCGFALFWQFGAITGGAPFFFLIWGIPLLLMGLYLIVGRHFLDRLQRSMTYYALTNERAIIISGLFSRDIRSLDLKKLPEINLSMKANGRGTITFGALTLNSWLYADGSFPNEGKYQRAPSFDLIEDARTVYRYIKDLQRER